MKEQNKNSFTSMSLPPQKEIDAANRYKQGWNKKIAKGIGVVVCALAITAPVIKQVDSVATNLIWQTDAVEVAYIDVVQETPAEYKQEAYVAFPGVGQKDTKNAATEHFRAINNELPTAYVSLPNQGFTIQELAHEFDALVDEHQLEKVNIIGVSAGTQLALQTITYIEEHPDEFTDTPEELPLPEIGYFLANSSPYNVMSAYKGPIIEPTMNVLNSTKYRSGIAEKFIYSLVDGPGDVQMLLPSATRLINVSYLYDSFRQTFNSTAPLMVQDHLTVLNDFNAEKEKNAWKKVLTPTAKFLYFYPSEGRDAVIDNENAYRQFSETLQELNVSAEYVPTESSEHADTVQAAVAFGHWLLQIQSVNTKMYNPYPEASAKPVTN